MLPLSEASRLELLGMIDNRYRTPVESYLINARNNEEWLSTFPESMEWLLTVSLANLTKTFAELNQLPYKPSRQEETPTIGNQFLELAQRRHTAVNALIPGASGEPAELAYGSGWQQVNASVRDVEKPKLKEIIGAYGSATDRLLQRLLITPFGLDIIQKIPNTDEIARRLDPIAVIRELTNHEKGHVDMFRAVFDAIRAPFPPSYRLAVTTPIRK